MHTLSRLTTLLLVAVDVSSSSVSKRAVKVDDWYDDAWYDGNNDGSESDAYIGGGR